MGSSNRKPKHLSPEEAVRQHLIGQLIQLGYPHSLMVVEKALSELPHLQGRPHIPNRRLDLLCYSRSHKPLLLCECKAEHLSKEAERQVIGYNTFVGAPFIALVSRTEARTAQLREGVWEFKPGLLLPRDELLG